MHTGKNLCIFKEMITWIRKVQSRRFQWRIEQFWSVLFRMMTRGLYCMAKYIYQVIQHPILFVKDPLVSDLLTMFESRLENVQLRFSLGFFNPTFIILRK